MLDVVSEMVLRSNTEYLFLIMKLDKSNSMLHFSFSSSDKMLLCCIQCCLLCCGCVCLVLMDPDSFCIRLETPLKMNCRYINIHVWTWTRGVLLEYDWVVKTSCWLDAKVNILPKKYIFPCEHFFWEKFSEYNSQMLERPIRSLLIFSINLKAGIQMLMVFQNLKIKLLYLQQELLSS